MVTNTLTCRLPEALVTALVTVMYVTGSRTQEYTEAILFTQ